MSITLKNNTTNVTVELPDALDWTDEFTWSAVEQTKSYTSTGALLVEEAEKQAGRPYTLQGGIDRTWCTRDLVKTLNGWKSAGLVFTLTIRGEDATVIFDHEKGGLEGFPVMFYADGSIDDSDSYVPTLRLIGI